MAAAPPTKKHEKTCMYCLQGFSTMTEPRRLPCSHICCLPCVEQAIAHRGLTAITCEECGTYFNIPHPRELQSLGVYQPSDVPDVCNFCVGKKKDVATSYCNNCQKFLCWEHFKMHGHFFKDHSMRDIVHSEEINRKLQQPDVMCTRHNNVKLTMGCKMCHEMFCLSCDTDGDCPNIPGKNNHHAILSLAKLAEFLTNALAVSMSNLDNTITEMLRFDKKAMRDMSEIEERVEKKINELKARPAEQTASMIQNLEIYRKQNDECKCRYIELLLQWEEAAQVLQTSVNNHVTTSTDADIIGCYRDMDSKLLKKSKTKFISCRLQKVLPNLNDPIKHIDMKIRIFRSSPPTNIKDSQRIMLHCLSVHWTRRGNLIAGAINNLKRYNRMLFEMKNVQMERINIHSITEFDTETPVVMRKTEDNNYLLTILDEHFTVSKVLDKFPAYQNQQHISFNHAASVIMAVDSANQQVKVYTKEGNLQQSVPMKSHTLCGIHSLPDGSFLVSDSGSGVVHKYEWLDNPHCVWTCEGLKSPVAITSDEDFIYVLGGDRTQGAMFYVLSELGEKIRTTFTACLCAETVTDISIFGNVLAAACGPEGLKIFNVLREENEDV